MALQILDGFLEYILPRGAEHREVIGMEADAHVILFGIIAKLLKLCRERRDRVPVA
ncbi:hypothetical protein D3C85_1885510 [compost metagenome]